MAGATVSDPPALSGGGMPTPERADASAWLAVAAGNLGALMATLDISIVNSSLPTIQGEIGATGAEGTWVGTAYLIAEIIVIPMAGWFERLLGLRTLLLVAAGLFTAFSVMCGMADSLAMMILGRVGQGLTGGAMIPTAQSIIATRLPPRQQPVGIAFFGVTAVMGPVLGPLIGGWLTETFSWHYAFFINLPICAVLGVLLLVGLPHQPSRFDRLKEADWLGVAGLALGLGGLTVLLEEGQSEQWFASSLIWTMASVAAAGFLLLLVGQFTAKRPVIKLALLLNRQFGSVAVMAMLFGGVIVGSAYAIPQFLAMIANYNALQAGRVVLIAGFPSFVLLAMVPILVRVIDLRIAVVTGLAFVGGASLLDAHLSLNSSGGDFVASQIMRGTGQVLGMVFLNQAAMQSVSREDAGDVAGLFNAMRNLGGSLALACISILQDQRLWVHSRRIEETLSANSLLVQDRVADLARASGGTPAALQMLSQQIHAHALVLTFNDLFWTMTIGALLVSPLVLFLRPLPKNTSAAALH